MEHPLDFLVNLVTQAARTPMYAKDLKCGADVATALSGVLSAGFGDSLGDGVITSFMQLTAVSIIVIDDAPPNYWKLTQHDNCRVVDPAWDEVGDGFFVAAPNTPLPYVSHTDCTIIEEGTLV